jgi:hypothetical protein
VNYEIKCYVFIDQLHELQPCNVRLLVSDLSPRTPEFDGGHSTCDSWWEKRNWDRIFFLSKYLGFPLIYWRSLLVFNCKLSLNRETDGRSLGLSEIGEHDERNLLLYSFTSYGVEGNRTLLWTVSVFGFSFFFKTLWTNVLHFFCLFISLVLEKCYASFARLSFRKQCSSHCTCCSVTSFLPKAGSHFPT